MGRESGTSTGFDRRAADRDGCHDSSPVIAGVAPRTRGRRSRPQIWIRSSGPNRHRYRALLARLNVAAGIVGAPATCRLGRVRFGRGARRPHRVDGIIPAPDPHRLRSMPTGSAWRIVTPATAPLSEHEMLRFTPGGTMSL